MANNYLFKQLLIIVPTNNYSANKENADKECADKER